MDLFFDEQGKIRHYEILSGELVLKNENGHIPVPEDKKVFYEENLFDVVIDEEQIKLAIYDDLNTRIEKKCKCGNTVAVIFRQKNHTLYICDKCGKY